MRMIERVARALARMAERGYEFESRESIKKILGKLGLSESAVDRIYIEFKNESSRDVYEDTRPSERVLLLPHCMMHQEGCRATQVDTGYECGQCGRCELEELTELAEEMGYDHFIVPGGSMVRKIVDRNDYEAAVGVACFPELMDANRYLEKNGVKMMMAKLDDDGCFMTSVSVGEVERLMRMGGEDLEQEGSLDDAFDEELISIAEESDV